MNKKTLRIAGWALGLSMAVAGIGVAVGVNAKAPMETKADATRTFEKITSMSGLSSGSNYLIVYEVSSTSGKAFNGSLSTIDATSNFQNVTISDGTITTTSDCYFTITQKQGGYSIRGSGGKYIGSSANSNQLLNGDSDTYTNSISWDDDNDIFLIKGTSTTHLVFNNTSGQTRFRYYKDTTCSSGVGTGSYYPISLYKELIISDPTITLSEDSLLLNGNESKNVNVSFAALTENISVAQSSDNGGEVVIANSISKDAAKPYAFAVTGKSAGTVVVTFSSAGAESKSLTVTVTDWTYSDIQLSIDEETFVGEYYVDGETNLAGITVEVVETSTFPGGTRRIDVTEDAEFNFDTSSTGVKQLIATYGGHSTDEKIYYRVSEEPEAAIKFGTNDVKIDDATIDADDANGNSWRITTAGTTSYTGNAAYYQVGSSSKPASSITFTATIASQPINITSFSAKFGGFNGTAGTITLKVGDTTVGTGSLNGTSDVVVSNSSSTSGTTLTITVTSISKGVKVYWINYSAKTDKELVTKFVADYMHLTDYDTDLDNSGADGSCEGYYILAKKAFNALSASQKSVFLNDGDFANAKARLSAWAIANHEVFNLATGAFNAPIIAPVSSATEQNGETLPLLITVAAIGVATAGGYFFVSHRRREE